VSDAPSDYITTMLRAIVGIEIPLSSLTGKWKVSQNRNAADREGVARGLSDLGTADATAMAKLVKP
jgi:transcriptional regulator